jgi:hypothetical protein
VRETTAAGLRLLAVTEGDDPTAPSQQLTFACGGAPVGRRAAQRMPAGDVAPDVRRTRHLTWCG